MKSPSEYSVQEVGYFLVASGLGSHVEKFREQGVDGALLVNLGAEDAHELGLSGLQGKKLLLAIEAAQEVAGGGGGGGNTEALTREIQELRNENASLKAVLKEYRATSTPAPAPAPVARAAAPSHHYQEHPRPIHAPVLGGAAKGATRGAIIGAIGGAIAGDPGKGAAMGAAMGGAAGGMRGIFL